MQKIQFKFNKNEVKSLFNMLNIADFNAIEDKTKQVYIKHILEKVYFKLAKKIAQVADKCTLSFNIAECLSLFEVLHTIDDIDLSDYGRAVKHQIISKIHGKYIA